MSSNDFYFKIAFATQSGERIDGHFGSCSHFAIYQFNATDSALLETIEASQDKGIDKNDYRAQQLQGCHFLYVASIGGPAAAKVIKSGIHPLKDPSEGRIDQALLRLQTVLQNNPPPWMAKLLKQQPSAA